MAQAPIDPCLFVIFGATSDLMSRKLLPALHRLGVQGKLGSHCHILGVSRSREINDQTFRDMARRSIEAARLVPQGTNGTWCDDCLHYRAMGQGSPEEFQALAKEIEALENQLNLPGNRVFYLALPPQTFPKVIQALGETGLSKSKGWRRLVVEKPFGRDLSSAKELNHLVHQYFAEPEVYRIDHYLGKETVQNLLSFRFANPIFENLWNRDRVEHVQITVAEDLGTEDRTGYYEQAGALRDMVQNHLTQLLCLIAMEVPGTFEAEPIRNEKIKVMRSIAPLGPADVVFGQYTSGEIRGEAVPAYRQARKVAPDSEVETYVAMKLEISNWRWQGVPFYLRTGKRMDRRATQIVVNFRRAPVSVFQSLECENVHSNVLVIAIQPDEGFELFFEVKEPGQPLNLKTEKLRFRYAEAFSPLPDAYETLLLDVLAGDQTLFVRSDWVEASWGLYTPVLEKPPKVHFYPAGSWGPEAANHLLAKIGMQWFPF